MPSRSDMRRRLAAIAFALTAAGALAAASVHQEPSRTAAASPGPEEISRAIAAVKADPNLATERTVKSLRWKESTSTPAKRPPMRLNWLAGLFGWIDQSARVLVWCAAVVLAGFLVVWLIRMVREYDAPIRNETFVAPTHVRDLDIRPETLPDDIGGTARALWDAGEHRASLALLYRGLLSRLAHVHQVPIRDSTTEGDCLELAVARLGPRRRDYVSLLVGVWQRFVYGREEVRAATVHALCAGFSSALDVRRTP